MSNTIKIAVFAAVIFMITCVISGYLQLVNSKNALFEVVLSISIAILVLVGIIKGQRLAWQWGRVFGFLGAINAIYQTYRIYTEFPELVELIVLYGAQATALVLIFLLLGTQGAKDHFRLQCTSCGSKKVKAINFLYTKAKCRKCDAIWA